jgi:hypothetical protein
MINLFIPWYNDAAFIRQQELDWCLNHNNKNSMINNIFLFPDSKKNNIPELSKKVHIIHLNRRVTYQDMLCKINSIIDSYNSYNIIMNTDIYFDESLELLKMIDMRNKCLSLTRWEAHPNIPDCKPYMYMNYESQDCWIFKSYVNMNVQCDFNLGKLGCDGKFNFELEKVGYKVYNPSLSIRALHYHFSGKRNYSEDDRLQGPTFSPPIINIKDIL